MDHRRLQRTLFRMHLDAGFAGAIRRGDGAACASTGLEADDLRLLRDADAAGIAADKNGRRRMQVAGNVAAEFLLAVALGAEGRGGSALVDGFFASPEFHDAVVHDESFALAFARYLERIALTVKQPMFAAFVALEAAMARVRRERGDAPRLAPDEVVRRPSARLVPLPEGTLDHASRLRAALDRGETLPPPPPRVARDRATVLVAAAPSVPHRLPDVKVEALSPVVASFLERASKPMLRAARDAFARECEATPAELDEMVAEFVRDGVLSIGSHG
jgi:hypothetical protein